MPADPIEQTQSQCLGEGTRTTDAPLGHLCREELDGCQPIRVLEHPDEGRKVIALLVATQNDESAG